MTEQQKLSKKGKPYSSNYHAIDMRNRREKDQLYGSQYVWVIETKNNQQIVFKNKKDVKVKKINKSDLNDSFIQGY